MLPYYSAYVFCIVDEGPAIHYRRNINPYHFNPEKNLVVQA